MPGTARHHTGKARRRRYSKGPSHSSSLGASLQETLTIQQKAGQIAALLLRVQSEFVKYGKAVDIAKKRAESTVKAMNKLSTRQRVMGRTLKGVSTIEGVATEVPSGEHAFFPIEMNDLVDDEEEAADTDDLDETDGEEGEAQTQS